MEKMINLGEKEVTLKVNAAFPRIYRSMFSRDIFKDMSSILSRYQQANLAEANVAWESPEQALDLMGEHDLEIMENVTYVMAVSGMPELQNLSIVDWLALYSYREMAVMQQEAITLWILDNYTLAEPKKKAAPLSGT